MRSKIYLWLLLLFVSGFATAQHRSKVELEERKGVVYKIGSDIPFTGVGVVYMDDRLDEKIHYVDGIRDGLTTKYESVSFPENKEPRFGILTYEVNYKNGLKEGLEYFYAPYGGYVYKRVQYVNGLKEGVEYNGNNYVAYKNGVKEGPEVTVGSYNNVGLYVNYVNGKEEGIKYYNYALEGGMTPTMHIENVLPYKNGKLDGEGSNKGSNFNRVFYYYNFKNGRKNGKEEYVDTSDYTLKRKVSNYVNGKLEGVATYYEHDDVLAEVPYVNGRTHGVRKDYNQEGKVIKEVYYSNGECVASKADIKEDVYVGKVIVIDSLQVKEGITYEKDSREPYTGKAEEYDERGEFRKDYFYVNGIVEQENTYYEGMFYDKKYYKNGEVDRYYYVPGVPRETTKITQFVQVEGRKNMNKENTKPVVVKMYEGAESGNGEMNSKASDKRFGVDIVNGRREGIWKFDIDEKGVPSKQGVYVNNRQEGDVIGKDGKTVIEQYRDGLLHGEKAGYEDINQKVGVTTYVDGYITGVVSRYHKNNIGSFLVETNYKHSLPYGEVRYYNEKGVLTGSRNFEYGILQGISREYHENGKVKTEVNYVDDEKQGEENTYSLTGELLNTVCYNRGKVEGYLVTFHNNTTKATECNYVNGLEEGDKKVYDANGVMTEKTTYHKGYINGEQIKYWPNTTVIKQIESFRMGKQHGDFKKYDLNGVLKEVMTYTYGKYDGVKKRYHENGMLEEESYYIDNLLQGESVSYWKDGNLAGVTCFVNGKEEGLSFSYHLNGKLSSTKNFKEGKLEGEFLSYYIDGLLRGRFNYKNNYLDGIVVIYGGSGLIESEVPYEHGEKMGEAKYYHSNGFLKSRIRYIGGKSVGIEYHYNEKGEEIKPRYKL